LHPHNIKSLCKEQTLNKQNMDKKFKSGDVVVLKSGSPKMTVKEYRQKDVFDPQIPLKVIGKKDTTIVVCEYYANNELQCVDHEQDSLELSQS